MWSLPIICRLFSHKKPLVFPHLHVSRVPLKATHHDVTRHRWCCSGCPAVSASTWRRCCRWIAPCTSRWSPGESHGLILFDDHVMTDFNQPIYSWIIMNPYESHILIDFHILLPGLVNVYSLRTGKIHHAINGKTHYFYGHGFNDHPSMGFWSDSTHGLGGFRFVIGLPRATSSIYRWYL